MVYYDLGPNIIAFTTDRTVGRDGDALFAALQSDGKLPTTTRGTLIYPHQTHTDRCVAITPQLLALPEEQIKAELEGVDAIIYSEPVGEACSSPTVEAGWGLALGISTADCIPVLIYDPQHRCAAAIHAGWKGTVQRIVEKTLRMMQERYATDPSQCTAAIGPGISTESFEVGWEVVERFRNEGFALDDEVLRQYPPSAAYQGDGLAPHLDLKAINRRQLLSMGIPTANITVSPIDTFTDTRFFSARREQRGGIKCGRILTGFLFV